MQKIRERRLRLLGQGVDELCEKIDQRNDIFLAERPFLTGGERKITYQDQAMQEVAVEIKSIALELMSQVNEMRGGPSWKR